MMGTDTDSWSTSQMIDRLSSHLKNSNQQRVQDKWKQASLSVQKRGMKRASGDVVDYKLLLLLFRGWGWIDERDSG
jgi:hypothetical protein